MKNFEADVIVLNSIGSKLRHKEPMSLCKKIKKQLYSF